MTYNIRLGIQQGVEAIARVIAAQKPDIIALQEVGKNWCMGPDGDTSAEIARLAGFEHFYYVPTIHEDPEHRYGHALLSRWPIEHPRIFNFTQNIDEPRAALLARIATPDGPVRVIATHLSHKEDERALQAPELLELLEEFRADGEPTMIMGDLNEVEDADWMRRLAAGMSSAGERAGALTFPNPAPTRRIDHILLSQADLIRAEVLDEADASDHRPLVAEVAIAPAT
jgi:endonuclease/exonuclease/phosphatase family metal-dependent hydrolase